MTELEAKAKDCIENHTHKLVDKPTKQDVYLREESIFISGYKLGATENGIQWHKVADGDLPKDDKNYLIITDDGKYYIAKHFPNDNYWVCKVNIYVSFIENVVAWCEIPQFKE